MNVPPSAKPRLTLTGADAVTQARLRRYRPLIVTLARVEDVEEAGAAPAGSALFVAGEATGALGIAEFIDVAAERARLEKEVRTLHGDAERTRKKPDNPDFVARAPEAVVEENRERPVAPELAPAQLQAALGLLAARAVPPPGPV